MAIIINKSESVKVLKAIGLVTLRLFPGPNKVMDDNLMDYFKTKASKAIKEEYLKIDDYANLDEEGKKLAEESKKKNEMLNKAQKMVATQNNKLIKNKKIMEGQANEIKELLKRIEKLEKKGKR